MKIILGKRQSGKTTELIKLAAKGRYKLIVVQNRNIADWTWRKILEMEKNKEIEFHPPQPITYQEFLEKKYYGQNIEAFLIDNVELLLQYLSHVPIEAITLNEG